MDGAGGVVVVSTLYCPACEAPSVAATALGFLGNDGALGTLPGFACRACHYIWTDADGEPTVTGHVDLGGQRPVDWFIGRLRAHGCNPRRRS